jgi:hypothetical protein
MPTTTNFGWTTPADTDLVKDGAAAIRTLAGNIDTSLVDLKGGTTGQFLSKNSNTDLDFVFATPSSGGMTLLSTTTLSGASTTISVSATGYINLFVQVTNVNQSASDAFRLAINGDTNLTQALQYLNYTEGVQGADGYNSTYYQSHSSKSGNTNNVYTYNIHNVTSTSSYKTIASVFGYLDGSDRNAMDWGAGFYRSNSAITSLVFSPASGTFSAGTVKVYGVK